MANDFTSSIWYVDTPYNSVPAGDIRASQVHIRSINWSQMAVGDQLVMTDVNGKVIYSLTAKDTNESINLPSLSWTRGILVPTLTGGNIQISVNM